MARQRSKVSAALRIGVAMAAGTAVVAGLVVINGIAPALATTTPSAVQTMAASERQWERTAELQEFRTSDNRGAFYTLNKREAAAASAVHGFRPTGEAAGILLFTGQVPGSIPVHRLRRVGVPFHTYIVSSFPPEIAALTAPQAALRFVDEGVLGYAFPQSQEGTMALFRYAKGSEWRIARDNRRDLLNAGFQKSSAPIGFVPEG